MSTFEIRESSGVALRLAILGLALAAALPAAAQAPVPVGAEFQINAFPAAEQRYPAVAMASDGSFVLVWTSDESFETDTSERSVQGQRYASDGSPQAGQFQVNTYTMLSQYDPSVAMAGDGAFVVMWVSDGSFGTDNDGFSIQGQRYASNGSPQGSQFQVNTYTTDSDEEPCVTMAANGDFVVTWQSFGSFGTDTAASSIQAQRFASDGSPQSTQFQVNTYTTSVQYGPSVAMTTGGAFVVAWRSYGSSGTDTSLDSIQGQRFASNGSAQGAQFQVNTYTTNNQSYPAVAAAPDASFIVAWTSKASAGSDTSYDSIQAQRYDANGSPQGMQFQVNTYTTSVQIYPSVAADDRGFIVVWRSAGSSGTDISDTSIQARYFASDGSAQGPDFQVNSYTPQVQSYPAVKASAGGSFVVVWDSEQSFGSHPNSESIHGQLYRVPVVVPSMSLATRLTACAALLLVAAITLRSRTSARSPSQPPPARGAASD